MTDTTEGMPFLDLTNADHFNMFQAMNAATSHMMGGAWKIIDGYFSFDLDTDVDLKPWRKTISAGTYYVKEGINGELTETVSGKAAIYGEDVDYGEETVSYEDPYEKDAVAQIVYDITNDVYDTEKKPIYLAPNRPLAYVDLLIWLAIQDADNAGNTALGNTIIRIVYDADRDEILGIVDTTAPEYTEPPELDGLKPTTHYEPNAKTTNVLTDPRLFSGMAVLDVGKKVGQLAIEFGLSFTDEEPTASIETTEPLEREDVGVIAAVVTLKNAGNNVISPFQIAEAMGYPNPPTELQEEIHERVMKLRRIDGRIDWTAQAKLYGIVDPDTGKPFERAEITGHLIDCSVFDGTDVDGHRCIRYRLMSDPITYQHAHQLGQVVDYPQRLLEVKPIDVDGKRKRRVTRDQMQIERAVLKFVHIVKNPNSKTNDSIRYDTLFEHAGVDVSHSKRRQRAVVFVNDYLRALQEEKVIRGFQVETRGASHKPISVRVVVTKRGRRKKTAVE